MATKKELRAKGRKISATVWLGKSELDFKIIAEIRKQLKTKKLVKIKMLKSFLESHDKKEVALELAEKCKADLIDLVGFVVVLHRR